MSQKITQVHNVSPEELTSQIVQAVQLITSQKEKYLEKEKPIGVKEVSKYLGCSPNHVRKQCSEKIIPHHRVPGAKSKIYFFESELEEFIKDGKVKTIKDLGIEADTFINGLGLTNKN